MLYVSGSFPFGETEMVVRFFSSSFLRIIQRYCNVSFGSLQFADLGFVT